MIPFQVNYPTTINKFYQRSQTNRRLSMLIKGRVFASGNIVGAPVEDSNLPIGTTYRRRK